MAIQTIGDLLKILTIYKDKYPEFEKYLLCVDQAPKCLSFHDLRDIELYINTDIEQVEICPTDKIIFSDTKLNNKINRIANEKYKEKSNGIHEHSYLQGFTDGFYTCMED